MTQLTVEVTQGCIDRGVRRNPTLCPLANAVLDATLNAKAGEEIKYVRVAGNYIRLIYGVGGVVLLRMSAALARLIRRYDSGQFIYPFSVHLVWEGSSDGHAELIGDQCQIPVLPRLNRWNRLVD